MTELIFQDICSINCYDDLQLGEKGMLQVGINGWEVIGVETKGDRMSFSDNHVSNTTSKVSPSPL